MDREKLIDDILVAFEVHDVDRLQKCLQAGLHPNDMVRGRPLIWLLIEMYLRGPGFKACMKAMVDHGLSFTDKALLAVLLDDEKLLAIELDADANIVNKIYSFACTFTPIYGCTLLHICAEYNHTSCGKLLLEAGANVDAVAHVDADGCGGHTPIFHTVNQHQNNSLPMLKMLIDYGANLSHHVTGLRWGQGFEWETYIAEVNPTSYAMMGLLPQFQRKEADIYHVVSLLQQAQHGRSIEARNVPNKYLFG